jgi:hypothetical protein
MVHSGLALKFPVFVFLRKFSTVVIHRKLSYLRHNEVTQVVIYSKSVKFNPVPFSSIESCDIDLLTS